MGIIKTSKLVHEFIRRDEEGNVESITTALDNVNLDIKRDSLLQSSVTMVQENQLLQSISMHFLRRATAPYGWMAWMCQRKRMSYLSKSAGMVFQNPDNQIIANVVEEDVGFGPRILVCRQMKSGSAWTMH